MNVNVRNFLVVGVMAVLFIVILRAILARVEVPFLTDIVEQV